MICVCVCVHVCMYMYDICIYIYIYIYMHNIFIRYPKVKRRLGEEISRVYFVMIVRGAQVVVVHLSVFFFIIYSYFVIHIRGA